MMLLGRAPKKEFQSVAPESISVRRAILFRLQASGVNPNSSFQNQQLALKNYLNLAVYITQTMIKKLVTLPLLTFSIFHLLICIPAEAAVASLTAPSAILLESGTDRILYQRAPHRKQSPASTAKIMTALVALDQLSLDQWITIDPSVETREPSKLYLEGGQRIRVRDLIMAILMKSANDAAAALAIEVAGSEWRFAQLMTEKARQLGAQNTQFVNASGLPAEGQYSTVYDLALMMREATKNDFIVSTLHQKDATITTSGGKKYYIKSHNKMLWREQKVIGKTGWTRRSKHCFVGLIDGGAQEAIVSVLGSKKLWIDLASLVAQITGVKKSGDILSYGSRGKEVEELQIALRQLGYFKGSATAYYGSITKRAVARFQRAQGISADGIVGQKTKEALAPYL